MRVIDIHPELSRQDLIKQDESTLTIQDPNEKDANIPVQRATSIGQLTEQAIREMPDLYALIVLGYN
jgi:hypothetical protein